MSYKSKSNYLVEISFCKECHKVEKFCECEMRNHLHSPTVRKAVKLIMTEHKIEEPEAYKILRKESMDRRRTIDDMASLMIYSRSIGQNLGSRKG